MCVCVRVCVCDASVGALGFEFGFGWVDGCLVVGCLGWMACGRLVACCGLMSGWLGWMVGCLERWLSWCVRAV